MNTILGRININQNLLNRSLINESIDKLCTFPHMKKKVTIGNHWGFGQAIFPPFKDMGQKPQLKSSLVIVSDCTLYNKAGLIKKLNLTGKLINDELIILKAFEKWRVACVNHLLGDFAFAIWNSETKELFCARDHFGIKPFCYYFDNQNFVFSSFISGILTQKDLKVSIDEQYIADTISFIKSENFRTTYNEIRNLPPSHYLILKQDQLKIERYWKLNPQPVLTKSDDEIIEEFKSILIKSVKCRLSDENFTGTELSGGIDSSSVTAIASKFTQIMTFSHVMPGNLLGKIHPFKDEKKFIDLLTDYCNISDRHYIKSQDIPLIEAIKQNIFDYCGLTQQSFNVFSDHLYESVMQNNIHVLLSGFGGDEVVSSKALGYLSELAKNKKWKKLKNEIKGQKLGRYQYLITFVKYYVKINLPFIKKIIYITKKKKSKKYVKFENLAINNYFSKKLNIKKRYFLDPDKRDKLTMQERNIERITHSHVSQRLEYCSLMARKYGIEYRYPLLDKRLIEYYLAIPTRLKAKDEIGRNVIRKVIDGIVPKEIQNRNDKSGATIPTVYMRMLNDKNNIIEIINMARLNKITRNYINPDKFEKWFYNYCNGSDKIRKFNPPGAFFNYLKLILFIEQNPSLFK